MAQTRKETEGRYQWDLSRIYADESAFEADLCRAQEAAAAFARFDGALKSGAALYEALEEETQIGLLAGRLGQYAARRSDRDKSDNAALSLLGRVRKLYTDLGAASAFLAPQIVRIPEKTLDAWFREEPRLEAYRRSLYVIRRYRPHTLSQEGEKLLADLAEGANSQGEIRGIFAAADLRFGSIRDEEGRKIRVEDSTYTTLMMSPSRRVRQAAFRTLYRTYEQFGNTFAALMNAYAKERHAAAKVAKFGSVLEQSTFADEVTPAIYNNLIETVNKRLDVLFDYYDLKREALGLKALHLYDIYTPLVGSAGRRYSYEEAVEEVLKTAELFGAEYHDTLEKGLKERQWVDVFPARGKSGGAYSSGSYDTEPLILMNFTGTMDSVSTLAHESGHSMHTCFANAANTPQDADYTLFVAEVASTVNELLFCHRCLRESDNREEKLAILNQLMETYKGTLFRQTMFAEFERELHDLCARGVPLTQETLNDLYYGIVKRYFGPRVVCDRQIRLEWMRIPHFYRCFYVYKYATSISAASSLVKKLESGDGDAVRRYLDFLRVGGSKSPLDSLLVAGVDLTQPQVIHDAIDDFADTIRQYRELMG